MGHSGERLACWWSTTSRPLRRIIRRRLEAEHFHVEEAGDGESALRLIQFRPFDLVLTDLLMPEIDGRQIHETLEAAPSDGSGSLYVSLCRRGATDRSG